MDIATLTTRELFRELAEASVQVAELRTAEARQEAAAVALGARMHAAESDNLRGPADRYAYAYRDEALAFLVFKAGVPYAVIGSPVPSCSDLDERLAEIATSAPDERSMTDDQWDAVVAGRVLTDAAEAIDAALIAGVAR